jgi:hypothetical protein
MKIKLITLTVFILAIGLNTAEAQQRQKIQRHRMAQGLRSGELTRPETRRIVRMQCNNHRLIRDARSDGFISRRERNIIRADRNKTSRVIFRSKHNNRERF